MSHQRENTNKETEIIKQKTLKLENKIMLMNYISDQRLFKNHPCANVNKFG